MTPLDPRIHQALDGEIPRETLPPELRADVEALEAAARRLRATPDINSVAGRVMDEIRQAPVRMDRPRRLGAMWALAAAAAVVGILVVGRGRGPEGSLIGSEEGIADFVGHFPGAHSVEVVGSFNDWRPGTTALRDDDHDDVWRGALVLPAGQHQYMFVVDGERWVTDPLAGRYVDDGYGRQNAVLIVRPAVQR